MSAQSPSVSPQRLVGLWRREAIVFSDGTEDRTTRVLWGQARSLYVDQRIPADRPPARERSSFDDFSEDELLRLADQMGFAGHIVLEGDFCTWVRYIDFQPNTGRLDRGRLELDGETIHERGEASSILARDYHEIFHREQKAERRCAALRSFSWMEGGAHENDVGNAVLILIDDQFLFARARSKELPPAQSLRDLVAAAGNDRALIHAYLDCEISIGDIEGNDPWRVRSSTIPFREGHRLFPPSSVADNEETSSLELHGDHHFRHWRILESSVTRDDLLALFSQ